MRFQEKRQYPVRSHLFTTPFLGEENYFKTEVGRQNFCLEQLGDPIVDIGSSMPGKTFASGSATVFGNQDFYPGKLINEE